jgi:hypothetical protein
MSPQEKRHGVMARIRTSDLTIERPTLYHVSYPAFLWHCLMHKVGSTSVGTLTGEKATLIHISYIIRLSSD